MPEAVVEERARARVGQTLHGKYRLDRLLGIGGMASVYAATHRNKKRVAVKMLHPELSMHAGLRQRFMREGYVANTVEHPGAVAVLDDDVAEDGSAFLVMELLEGATLDDLCERQGGRMPLGHVLAIVEQLLDVLAAADAKNIVHRDIKPSNVFVTRQGQIKVLDFGVARLREGEGEQATHSGMALGTPAFMAPEQALGRSEEISGRTDVWAVGATMLSLLTGRAVHEASSAQEQMVLAATRPAASLGTFDVDAPAAVVAVVDRALQFDQGKRWQSAAEMRDAVQEAARAVLPEPVAPAVLGALAAEAGPAISAGSPSDPLAPTLAAPSGSGGSRGSGGSGVSGKPGPRSGARSGPAPARATPGPAVSPQATSLVGTSAQAATAATGRARMLGGAAVLVLAGAAVGAWLAMRAGPTAAPPAASAAAAPATGTTTATASASATASATASGSGSATGSGSASATASDIASASSVPSAVPRTRPGRVAPPTPSATAKPAPDSFDRQ